MTRIFKIALISLSVLATAGVAYAGTTKGFDVDCLMQSLEANVNLCKYKK